ncbi:glycosyl hydrolase [Massariosphaeria phaeospora]|uniref:Glycosyl hydrolase n=1 Tax=Massariosphaeria phaeospora TaxID=100035 RepID=A0A7C8MA96_9PLEO|nr:glycosyl hydrolase [Massariosphaeria phaeospora]
MKCFQSLFISILCVGPALANYEDNASSAIKTLQDEWYDVNTGLWNDLWWQSGNMVETIARLGRYDADFRPTASNIIANTYSKAANRKNATNWRNDFYDDMGWWAMAWISSYDMTGDRKYLNTAKDIFEDMTGGWTTPCGGGIWWDKPHTAIAAISNELFLSVAAHLTNRVSGDERTNYMHNAENEWDWFSRTGIINGDNLINDGIDLATCRNNGVTTWSYNQGVVLAGLSELSRATSNRDYTAYAHRIASATITKLTVNGILAEPVEEPPPPNDTDSQFKGAFVRGLAVLHANEPRQQYADFLKKNADAAWSLAKAADGVIGPKWQGPPNNANPASHASGIDVLVAAAQAG